MSAEQLSAIELEHRLALCEKENAELKQEREALQQKLEKAKEALKRLSSSDAFDFPKIMTSEEKLRKEFAIKALKELGEG